MLRRLAMLGVLVGPVAGQVPNRHHPEPGGGGWQFSRYSTAEGLPSDEVTGLLESRSGTLWAGTARGLAWFDGWLWHELPADSTGIPRRPPSLIADAPGDSVLVVVHNLLYIGTTTGFTRLAVVVEGKEKQVTSAATTKDGMLILIPPGSADPLPRLVRYRNNQFQLVTPPAELGNHDVAALFPGAGGVAWLNTTTGLWYNDGSGWTLRFPSGAVPFRVGAVLQREDGSGLFSLVSPDARAGLWEWNAGEQPRRRASEGEVRLLHASFARDGVAVAVYMGGQMRIREHDSWSTYDLPGSQILDARTVLHDHLGDTWIGTGSGLVLFRGSSGLWAGIPHGFPSPRDRINAIVTDTNDGTWAGTADGIDVFEADGSIRHIATALGKPVGGVTGLARDSAGNIWVARGSTPGGALRWDGKNWRLFGAGDGLLASRIHDISVDRSGRVWFLGLEGSAQSSSGPGAFVLDDGHFTQVGPEQGLPSGKVYAFAEAPDGTRWFGSGGGLSRWRKGAWTHWTQRTGRTGNRKFRAPLRVFTLAVDSTGKIWFGDQQEPLAYGIGTVDARDSLAFYTTADGLLNNRVWRLVAGADGTIWAATESGLSAMHDGNWFSFGTDRGLGYPQLWALEVDGTAVSVGTQGGGMRQLDLDAARQPPPRVTILESVTEGRRAYLRWMVVAYRGSLASALIETRYRVDGGTWSGWSTDRVATLNDMKPGEHRVEVQAKGLFLPLDPVSASAAIVVARPLMLRKEFAIPVGGLSVALLVLSIAGIRRKREADAVLRESETRFRTLSASTFEGIGISVDGSLVEANDQLHRMLGAAPGQLRGRRLADFLGGDADAPARRIDGSSFPAEIRERTIPYRGSEARVSTVRDLSEQQLADAALRASEERFERMFRSSPSSITIASYPDGPYIDVSEGFENLTGWTRAEAVGKTAEALGIFQGPADRSDLLDSVRATGSARGHEITITTRTGERRALLVSADLIQLDGKPHLLSVATDITERRSLEAQLVQSQKMEAIGQLAGGVAHDFNNLLTAIIGHADLVRDSLVDTEAVEDIDEIRRAAQRASDLTRQLLTFARKNQVKPSVVDLNDMVHRTQRMLGRLLGEQIVIVTQTASDLPPVTIDPGQIEQVLVNLAVNARDAMPTGGQLIIETHATELGEEYTREHPEVQPGKYAMIALTDTGTGIPAESLSRVFEPFFTTKGVGQGTGLGLAICYGIIREAGGHISLYSEAGRGTTVRVYLPRASAPVTTTVASSSTQPVRGGKEVILLVEDELLVRTLVERVLTNLGYSVLVAGNLEEAIAAVASAPAPPRLLISDVVLPGPGGPEIARAVRERVEGIAVLYISGYTERAANQAVVLDAPLLSKPFTPNALGRRVREVLDGV
ncbi:MAG: PAS domain S-box protein [Gemmatimonadota bacterium]